MLIGERLKEIREAKNLSQGEIEKRTGLMRCYTSRVENCYTTPAIETLEKYARALEVPLYALFYDGDSSPKAPAAPKPKNGKGGRKSSGKDARTMDRFQRYFSKASDSDRELLFTMAAQMARRAK